MGKDFSLNINMSLPVLKTKLLPKATVLRLGYWKNTALEATESSLSLLGYSLNKMIEGSAMQNVRGAFSHGGNWPFESA